MSSRPLPLNATHMSVHGRGVSSSLTQSESSDLFEYTTGNYMVSSALRLAERKVVFNVAELCRLAAQSVNRSPDEVVDIFKDRETVYDRTVIITMRDGFRMEAHIPYQCTIPRYFATASKAATMAFLRTHDIPVPQIYGYSPDANNAAGTEYIFMEFIVHPRLVEGWYYLNEADVISVARHLAELEAKMMSIPFPAGGALYYTEDLARVGAPHVPLPEDARFAVGPDSRPAMWCDEMTEMDVHRGPYKDAEATLLGPADKEIAYLKQFGRPQIPVERIKKIVYKNEQQPAEHIETLSRYRLLAPSLIPKDPDLARFRIRHRNVHGDNILVSRSSDGTLNIAAVIDWYHTVILPVFLLSYMPYGFGDFTVPLSRVMATPADYNESTDPGAEERKGEYQRHLVNHHYLEQVEKHNPLLYRCLEDTSVNLIRRELFRLAGQPWGADPLPLKMTFIAAATQWKSLRGVGHASCPIKFDMEAMGKTMEAYEYYGKVMTEMSQLQLMCNIATDNFVEEEGFKVAVERGRIAKQNALLDAMHGDGGGMFPELIKNWPFDDFNKEGKAICS
ncbi:protein kinase subdomain-containing protein PKL/CAK/Fmp29 [Roridomyces roridus]|uniref:Protein kinase subdomain-containing protein PKL/CAK/Fmp29 n=1 Tax=Roridomyces roridus TaxID=1738132 RepID=A0AAD7C898_9AGAR|nr:protein kinase subdomain-containing protein PKL/CAK/Fmp29 [Roridomyces roridus]